MLIKCDIDEYNLRCITLKNIRVYKNDEECKILEISNDNNPKLIFSSNYLHYKIPFLLNDNSTSYQLKLANITIKIYDMIVEKMLINENIKSLKDFIEPMLLLEKLGGN